MSWKDWEETKEFFQLDFDGGHFDYLDCFDDNYHMTARGRTMAEDMGR